MLALPGNNLTFSELNELTDEQRITTCDMTRRMLKFKAEERFSIGDVCKHPAFWEAGKKLNFFCVRPFSE